MARCCKGVVEGTGQGAKPRWLLCIDRILPQRPQALFKCGLRVSGSCDLMCYAITPLGAFLRRTKLDEPLLWNV